MSKFKIGDKVLNFKSGPFGNTYIGFEFEIVDFSKRNHKDSTTVYLCYSEKLNPIDGHGGGENRLWLTEKGKDTNFCYWLDDDSLRFSDEYILDKKLECLED